MVNGFNLFFFKFYFILIKFSFIISTVPFTYPNAVPLKNGNIFIIHKVGVTIYNPTNSTIIKNVIVFSESEQIINEDYFSKVTLVQFSDGYIASIIINKLYFFNEEGEYQTMQTLTSRTDLYYFLSNTGVYGVNHYFMYGYINQNSIYLRYRYYVPSTKIITIFADKDGLKDAE